ncbi:MAG: polyprenyl synthetase family protein, partial [Actinomycetota bacterium]|nr:polyprenyl synthetase family protein [Actinomycetota bacterium]
SLTSCACRIGALTAGLGNGEQEALGEFGEAFGLVFQIRDDILDVVATEDDLGKEAGQDLAKGIYTLPVLIALEDPDVGPELRSLLGVPLDQAARLAARSLVTESGAIADAVKEARRWADVAANAVSSLGRGEAVKALAGLPHALMDTVPVPAA